MKSLSLFRDMAQALSNRKRVPLVVTLTTGRILEAFYDPLFKTVTIDGNTFPEGEVSTWTRLLYGAPVQSITSHTTSKGE